MGSGLTSVSQCPLWALCGSELPQGPDSWALMTSLPPFPFCHQRGTSDSVTIGLKQPYLGNTQARLPRGLS